MRPQPLIAVRDVEASSRWYQQVLGCTSGHGGTAYERLMDGDRIVMQIHNLEVEHHHGRIGDPAAGPFGNGLLLWFEIDDFVEAVARTRTLDPPVVHDVHRNPPEGPGGPDHWEFWIRDPDGYVVVIASPDYSAEGRKAPPT